MYAGEDMLAALPVNTQAASSSNAGCKRDEAVTGSTVYGVQHVWMEIR